MKILLVDDDPLMQRMYGRALDEAGFACTTVNNGADALAAVAAELPDIILMDVMMPRLNGIEALQALKADERTRHIPVIMLSAYDNPNLMQLALDAGAARYLTKNSLEPKQVAAFAQTTFDQAAAAK